MALSKSIHQCRRCVRVQPYLQSRTIQAKSASTEKSISAAYKAKLTGFINNMSVSQRKLLNHLKEYVSKSSNENGAFFVLSKEWVALLQKLPYGQVSQSDTIQKRTFESSPSTLNKTPNTHIGISDTESVTHTQSKNNSEIMKLTPQETKPAEVQSYGSQVLNGIMLRMGSKPKELKDEAPIQWKPKKEVISGASISSRTKHVIASITAAESSVSKLTRLEDLTDHLREFPEAKHIAIKEGAIRTLLQLRHDVGREDKQILAILREAFAMLGYIEPLKGRGIRILSIDGGGIRGVLAIEMMKRLEELTGKRIYELFDYICGVSTGAILASVIVTQKRTLDEASVLYKELSTKIFTQNTFWGTSNLVWSHSYYDTEMWEQLLKTYLSETLLIKTVHDENMPKLSCVSTVVNKARVMAFLFRNYSLPHRMNSQYMGSHQHKIWEAVRASAAAPLYFEEFKLGEHLHQDGGILVNNPTAVAIHEARQLWPTSPIQCIVSLGTGRSNVVSKLPEDTNINMSSWKTKFLKILDSATDTEAVHTMLNDLLPNTKYHRFNPYINEMVSMDEISPEKLSQLEADAKAYYHRNEDKFQETAKALLEKRTVVQHLRDWINLQRDLMGYNN